MTQGKIISIEQILYLALRTPERDLDKAKTVISDALADLTQITGVDELAPAKEGEPGEGKPAESTESAEGTDAPVPSGPHVCPIILEAARKFLG